jgi:large subunit ribosomal protein L30
MALVKITQERSKIRCIEKHKRTLEALGLRRIDHSVVHEDTPQIRGMVELVRYLVRVEPADSVTAVGGATAPRPKKKAAPKKSGGAKKRKIAARKKARGTSSTKRKNLNTKGKKRESRS